MSTKPRALLVGYCGQFRDDFTFWSSEVDANEAELVITLQDITTTTVLRPYFVSLVSIVVSIMAV